MNNNVHLGDGMLDGAKADINNRAKGLIKIGIDAIFDYIEGKVQDFPKIIEQLHNSTEIEQEIAALWSEHLFEEASRAEAAIMACQIII